MRAKRPFFLARLSVLGKFSSTLWPTLRGIVIGAESSAPPLLILTLFALKKRFASGSHTLTGQVNSVLASLR